MNVLNEIYFVCVCVCVMESEGYVRQAVTHIEY